MDLPPYIPYLLLMLAAFFAGCVDAVVGGGGLIQIPSLFGVFPQASPATLFGTNKVASVFGTANAAWHYRRRVSIPWRATLPAALAAFVCSFVGAMAVAWLPPAVLRPLVLALLVLAAAYTLWHPDFGSVHAPLRQGWRELLLAVAVGGAIGFYDGFFGPGTGSFLIFLFVRVFGFDFLHASAASKIVNVATNVAALAYFLPTGHCLPLVAALMAAANVAGSALGTHLALRHGSALVRRIFLLVVALLILRFARDLQV
jgi:uncharacterized protein